METILVHKLTFHETPFSIEIVKWYDGTYEVEVWNDTTDELEYYNNNLQEYEEALTLYYAIIADPIAYL